MADQFTVLIVDDQAPNRILLNEMMIQLGHRPLLAENGVEALAEIRRLAPDLILLDLRMPLMDGVEVLKTLKGDSRFREIPVIIISASEEFELVIQCIRLGAEDYLPKPFKADLLRARIDSSLQRVALRRNERRLLEQLDSYLLQLKDAKKRSDDLLHVILPGEKVDELKATNQVKPRRHENVAVLFCDVVGFTAYCDQHEPEEVVAHLQKLVEMFEDVVERHGMEKTKTIGDAFMATAGLLKPVERPALNGVKCGLDMIRVSSDLPAQWQVRVGVHVGPVLTGVVGRTKYLFDLWGDTVNTAARVESHGIPGAVCVSKAAWQQISDVCRGESRGLIQVKGKGELELFRVDEVIA